MTTMTDDRKRVGLGDFVPATAQAARGLTLLIYGAPGAGKTTLAASAPAPLVVDLDRGARALADRADVQLYQPRDWAGLAALYPFLRAGGHPFGAVVLDSLTEAYRLALDLAQREDPNARPGAGPQLQHHGAATERLVKLVRAFGELADSGLHLILVAPESLKAEAGEDKDRLIRRPALPPRAWEGVQAAVDLVVRLLPARDGKRQLVLRSPSPLVVAKVRAPAGRIIPERLDNPTFTDLLALLGKDDPR